MSDDPDQQEALAAAYERGRQQGRYESDLDHGDFDTDDRKPFPDGWTHIGATEAGGQIFTAPAGTPPLPVRIFANERLPPGVPAPTQMACPCGDVHELSARTRVAYENITAGLPPDVLIAVPSLGAWYVPRIYLAAHGVKGDELPALAERYGFRPA